MSQRSHLDEAGETTEATEPEDDLVDALIGEPLDPTYLERISEETT